MDKLERKRRYVKKQLASIQARILDLLKEISNSSIVVKAENEFESFKTYYAQFEEISEQILELGVESNAENEEQLENAHFKECEELVTISNSIKTAIAVAKDKFSTQNGKDTILNSTSIVHSNGSAQPRLPKIDIPEFNGNPRDFLNWKNLFSNLVVDNPDIPNVKKLYFLKQALKDKATPIVRDFEINDHSFVEAWSTVLNRYENKRAIIEAHFLDLFHLRRVKNDSDIQELLDCVNVTLRGLKVANEGRDNWQPWISFLISMKLDDETRRDWVKSLTDNTKYPSYEEIKKFLEIRVQAIESQHSRRNEVLKKNEKTQSFNSYPKNKSTFVASSTTTCVLCKNSHPLWRCPEFIKRTPSERFDIIKTNRLCILCFAKDHRVAECKNRKCANCNQNHNTMLHRNNFEAHSKSNSVQCLKIENPSTVEYNPNLQKSVELGNSVNKTCQQVSANNLVILPTAVLKVKVRNNRYVLARALLDSASQVTLVTENFVRKNNLPCFHSSSEKSIVGITSDVIDCSKSSFFSIRSRFSKFEIRIEPDVVPFISYKSPTNIIRETANKFKDLRIADESLSHNNIDILIGAEYFEKCILDERKSFEDLFIRNTHFGWVMSGCEKLKSSFPLFCHVSTKLIDLQIAKFWEIEDVNPQKEINPEHDMCIEHFKTTFSRSIDGRFIVRLPLKNDRKKLSNSRNHAIRSLIRIEKRLKPEIKTEYIQFMREYLELGHMEPVKPIFDNSKVAYYIPHREVLRPSSTTTKLRVVFNASRKSDSGLSLNDLLATGPKIQTDLFDLLIKFRFHRFAFVADIEKMYRQVFIHPEDRDLQRIVWRESTKEPIQEFRLTTVTYGTASASFLAQQCLSTLSEDIQESDPEASRALREDFYMDDLLTGGDDLNSVMHLQKTIHATLENAHFFLRKYMSNSTIFLNSLEPSLVETTQNFEFSENCIHVLGLTWNPLEDVFQIRINLNTLPELITKRILLSEISRIFDPLGLASPVTINSKIFLQDLWRLGLNWDEPIPEPFSQKFRSYYNELAHLKDFKIARTFSSLIRSEDRLIGFCDASEKAYCAAIYLVRFNDSHESSSRLICAKTRVAPIKQITIPRLELQGALLLSKLIVRVSRRLKVNSKNIFLFSDSTVVLSWLNHPLERWNQFVANRVSSISKLVSVDRWFYVNTRENPADLGTRGIAPSKIVNNILWLQGPNFIKDYSDFYAFKLITKTEVVRLPEYRINKVCTNVVNINKPTLGFENFSSYMKVLNVIGYLLRFCSNCKVVPDKRVKSNILTVAERKQAFVSLVRNSQLAYFAMEIHSLQVFGNLVKNSSLKRLCPFLDKNNILRVGGRLMRSDFSVNVKHPIILSSKCHIFKLYIRFIHETYFHATRTFVVNFIKSRFWVTDGLNKTVKKILFQCVICSRFKGVTMEQIMGQLPKERISCSRPFDFVGIDFCGPFTTKCVAHRSYKFGKCYAAFFICLVTRAVHVEIVSDLSSAKFLDSFSRFIARRGTPTRVHSDNATNFVGAKNQLRLNTEDLLNFSSFRGIEWMFIPPRSPHHGGIWEAAIRIGKYHLNRATKNSIMSFEDYSTTFAAIESILNSRPISYKVNADDGPAMLTPAHFLIGKPLVSETLDSDSNVPPESIDLMELWKSHRAVLNSFWHNWRKDYLNDLQVRTKWFTRKNNLKVGEVVLIKDDQLRPGDWNMGVVVTTYPDPNGDVRVVDVKTQTGTKRRSISKLVRLLNDEPKLIGGEYVNK